jgi:hypothetical protein
VCTYWTERLEVEASAKGTQGWMRASEVLVSYDHPHHLLRDHSVNIDLLAPALGPSWRVAIELAPEAARTLATAILAALEQHDATVGDAALGAAVGAATTSRASEPEAPVAGGTRATIEAAP